MSAVSHVTDCPSPCLAYATNCIDMDEAPCNVLNMEFFDRLWVEGLVDEEGEMKKMKHDYLGQIPVDDQVRSVKTCLSVCLSVRPSVCISVRLSVLPVCLLLLFTTLSHSLFLFSTKT